MLHLDKNGHSETQMSYVEALLRRFRHYEDILLLFSVPGLVGILLLWALGSSALGNILVIAFIVNFLVTALTLIIACVLFVKWIDILQNQVQAMFSAWNEQNIYKVVGVILVCVFLIGLMLGTAATGGGEPRTALLIFLFILIGWHYRTLLKHVPKV